MDSRKTTEAQRRAAQKWNEKNKEHRKQRDYFAKGKRFIREYATLEELQELKELIAEKEKELKNNKVIKK